MKSNSFFYYFSLLGQLGFTIAASILVAVGIYKLIERVTGQNGFLFILMVILGVISGFYAAYKMIMDLSKKNKTL